jgi:hypothetical protein
MRFFVRLQVMASMMVLAPLAAAQEIPCEAGPCLQPKRRGTHFIAELNGGSSLHGKGGLALEGVLGVGGKLRGFPLRFYLVGEFAYSSSSDEGSLPAAGLPFSESRSHRDLALGLRVYIPVYRPVRLFFDLMGGGSHATAVFERAGLSTLSTQGWYPLALAAAGVQFRLFHHLSLGLRSRLVLTDDGMDELRKISGGDDSIRASITAGLTWHF